MALKPAPVSGYYTASPPPPSYAKGVKNRSKSSSSNSRTSGS
nr:MAG TPA: hypothetical protein [Caudoviricetes sp.]